MNPAQQNWTSGWSPQKKSFQIKLACRRYFQDLPPPTDSWFSCAFSKGWLKAKLQRFWAQPRYRFPARSEKSSRPCAVNSWNKGDTVHVEYVPVLNNPDPLQPGGRSREAFLKKVRIFLKKVLTSWLGLWYYNWAARKRRCWKAEMAGWKAGWKISKKWLTNGHWRDIISKLPRERAAVIGPWKLNNIKKLERNLYRDGKSR